MADKKITAKMYDTLRRPIITEKTSALGEQKVAFEVPVQSSKKEIADAVSAVYNVVVEKVNTMITAGKTRKFKGIFGKEGKIKKAYITLAKDSKIDIAA